MRGIALTVAFGLMLAVAPALAGQISEPIEHQYWCVHSQHPRGNTCGQLDGSDPSYVVTSWTPDDLKFSKDPEQPANFRFRVCSEAPSGNERCVARRTHRKRFDGVRHESFLIAFDSFPFTQQFPHRTPGTYKLRWYRDGGQIGRTLKVDLSACETARPEAAGRGCGPGGALSGRQVRSILNGLGYEIRYVRVDVPARGEVVAGSASDGANRLGFVVNTGGIGYVHRLKKSVPGHGGEVTFEGISTDNGESDLFIYHRYKRGNSEISADIAGALCEARLGRPCGV